MPGRRGLDCRATGLVSTTSAPRRSPGQSCLATNPRRAMRDSRCESLLCSQSKARPSWNGRSLPSGASLSRTSTSYSGSESPESACNCRFSRAVSNVPTRR